MKNYAVETYRDFATRLDNVYDEEVRTRMSTPFGMRISFIIHGLQSEIGELCDIMKRHYFYGEEVDMLSIHEELGDTMYYLELAFELLKTTSEKVQNINTAKLKVRHRGSVFNGKATGRPLRHRQREKFAMQCVMDGADVEYAIKQAYERYPENPEDEMVQDMVANITSTAFLENEGSNTCLY